MSEGGQGVETFPYLQGKTRDIVANKSGFGSHDTYNKAKYISENENRKDFSFSERMDYAKRLEVIEKLKAKERQANSTGGNNPQLRQNSDKAENGRTDELVANKSGFGSHDTYNKAKYISENENRKDFSFSERMDYAKRLEVIEKLKAKERQGERNDLNIVQDFVQSNNGRTNEIVSQKSGFGNKETYRQAKYVSENANEEMIKKLRKILRKVIATQNNNTGRAVPQDFVEQSKGETNEIVSQKSGFGNKEITNN